jgi:hypothetical protein
MNIIKRVYSEPEIGAASEKLAGGRLKRTTARSVEAARLILKRHTAALQSPPEAISIQPAPTPTAEPTSAPAGTQRPRKRRPITWNNWRPGWPLPAPIGPSELRKAGTVVSRR